MEALLPAVIAGDQAAWRRLWLALEPLIRSIAGNRRFTGRLHERDDERDNIVVAVMARLRADDFRHLRAFLARFRKGSFEKWVVTFAARTAIDYVRAHPEYERPPDVDTAGSRASGARWVRFEPAPDSSSAPAITTDITQLATAHHVVERAAHILTEPQHQALVLWLGDEDHEEIARRLGLMDATEAEKLVRAAVKRLRRDASGGDR